MMSAYFSLPFIFIKFWFLEAPKEIISFFFSLNRSFLQLLSLPLLLKTFFKPIKNEYRKGLVGFSIGMGMGIKSILIIVNLILFLPLILGEIVLLLLFILFPFLTCALLWL